jgi:hypothetical protein
VTTRSASRGRRGIEAHVVADRQAELTSRSAAAPRGRARRDATGHQQDERAPAAPS